MSAGHRRMRFSAFQSIFCSRFTLLCKSSHLGTRPSTPANSSQQDLSKSGSWAMHPYGGCQFCRVFASIQQYIHCLCSKATHAKGQEWLSFQPEHIFGESVSSWVFRNITLSTSGSTATCCGKWCSSSPLWQHTGGNDPPAQIEPLFTQLLAKKPWLAVNFQVFWILYNQKCVSKACITLKKKKHSVTGHHLYVLPSAYQTSRLCVHICSYCVCHVEFK